MRDHGFWDSAKECGDQLERQPGAEVCHGPHVGLGIPAALGKRSCLQDGLEFAKGIISLMSHKS